MKIPNLKKWLSYIIEIPVRQVSSDYSECLTLTIYKGNYQLSTRHAIYSFGDKYQNFREVFELSNLVNPPVKNVLLLGLGLGSIPCMLEKVFGFSMQFTAVEIDETVILLASKYTLDELNSPISIVQGDAETYVYQSEETFDLICVDVFVDDKIPTSMRTIEFANALKTRLTSSGFVVSNHLGLHRHDKIEATTYYAEVFKTVFPDSTYRMADNNMMMISDKSRISSNKPDIKVKRKL